MYHEEKIIGGLLYHRGTPDGKWELYSLEAVVIALIAERNAAIQHRNEYKQELDRLRAEYAEFKMYYEETPTSLHRRE